MPLTSVAPGCPRPPGADRLAGPGLALKRDAVSVETQVPKEEVDRKPVGGTKMDKDILARTMEQLRSRVTHRQVASGHEFKGRPFNSKPKLIHFKVRRSYSPGLLLRVLRGVRCQPQKGTRPGGQPPWKGTVRRSVLARSHSRQTLQGRRLAGSWDATRALVLQTEWGAGPRAHTIRGPQEAISCPRCPYSPCVPRGALPESGNLGTCSWSPIRTLLRSSPRPSSCGHTLAVRGHTRRGRQALTRRLPPDGFEGLP